MQLLRPIVLHLGVNIHCYSAVLMPRQVLYRLGVHHSVNQVGDVGVPKLMG